MSEILQGDTLLVPVAGFEVTPLGVVIHGDPSYDVWEVMVKQVLYVRAVLPWVLGDLLNFGESHYGEKYAQAIEVTGHEYQTLANYASVCRRVPMERRQAELSFSHHALVASQAPEEQTRLLYDAWDQYMTTAQLRAVVNEVGTDPIREPVAKPVLLAECEPVEEPVKPVAKPARLELTEAELRALIVLLEVEAPPHAGSDAGILLSSVWTKCEDLFLSL